MTHQNDISMSDLKTGLLSIITDALPLIIPVGSLYLLYTGFAPLQTA